MIRTDCPGSALRVLGTAPPAQRPSGNSCDGAGAADPTCSIDERDPFCMTYTGGTTGRPKGVLMNHRAREITAHTVVWKSALDRRRRGGHRHAAVPRRGAEHHVPAGGAGRRHLGVRHALVGRRLAGRGGAGEDHRRLHGADAGQRAGYAPRAGTAAISRAWTKLSFAGAPMPDWVQQELMQPPAAPAAHADLRPVGDGRHRRPAAGLVCRKAGHRRAASPTMSTSPCCARRHAPPPGRDGRGRLARRQPHDGLLRRAAADRGLLQARRRLGPVGRRRHHRRGGLHHA